MPSFIPLREFREKTLKLEYLYLKELLESADWIMSRAAILADTSPVTIKSLLKKHRDLLREWDRRRTDVLK